MSRIAMVATQAATTRGGGGDLESSLPGEWLTLWILVVMAAVLGAAVLAFGAAGHRRLTAQRVERWHEWRRRRPGPGERADGRERG